MITSGLFEHPDKNVRAASFNVTVELYRWLGSIVHTQISELRSVQKTELEQAFKDLADEKPQPSRRVRSEQETIESTPTKNQDADVAPQKKEAKQEEERFDMDPYDLADPVDIFSKISPETLENLNEKKWSTKADALDEILKAASVTKIAPNNQLADLIKSLKKLVTDINMQVNIKAILVIVDLAKGMRKSFPSAIVLQTLLQKFKEKKTSVTDPIHTALTTMLKSDCFTIPDILPGKPLF